MKFSRLAATAAVLLVPLAAHADPRQDVIDGMAKCAVINDSIDRLSCYDSLFPAVRAAQREAPSVATAPAPFVAAAPPGAADTAPAAPPVAAAPAAATPAVVDNRPWYSPSRILGVAPTEQTKPDQFGGENLAPPPPPPGQVAANEPPPEIDSITATVRDYSFNPYDKFIVVLDNGQIWQQLESDSGLARFMKGEKNSVTISRGMLGSYNLVVNDASILFKVRRLK